MINSKLFLLVVLLCISLVETFAKQESKEKLLLPVLNMQEKYSDEKVNIQDIGKVQYICFKVPDDVLLGDHLTFMPFRNSLFFYGRDQGEVLGFNLDGSFIGRFNRKGQGADEYAVIDKLAYDENKQEVYLLSKHKTLRLFVFDMKGNCKRVMPILDTFQPWNILFLDTDFLLAYDIANTAVFRDGKMEKLTPRDPAPAERPFILLDKNTGKIISKLPVSLKNRIRPFVKSRHQGLPWVFIAPMNYLVDGSNGQILNDPVADTTYLLLPNRSLKPILRRTPSLETMKDKTVLAVLAATPAYMLIKTFLLKHIEGEDKLNEKLYLYASKNKSFSGCEFHNRDFENAGDVFTNFYVANNKLYFILYPYVLLEALENGKLSGELMEITKTLDEEDNPIIMEVSLHIM